MVQLNPGEVAITLVIRARQIVRVEDAGGTKVTELSPELKQAYSQSDYGCRPVETIYETRQNPCFMIIGNMRIEIPCS